MVFRDEGRVVESPIVEVADDGDAVRVGRDEDELDGYRLAGGHLWGRPAEDPDGHHRHHTGSERGGPSGPPRDVGRGAEPTEDAAMPTLGVDAPHAHHDAAIERLVETNRMLELLDHELECRTAPIRHCEPPAAGRAAGRRRA